jgi:hypothetical protein
VDQARRRAEWHAQEAHALPRLSSASSQCPPVSREREGDRVAGRRCHLELRALVPPLQARTTGRNTNLDVRSKMMMSVAGRLRL